MSDVLEVPVCLYCGKRASRASLSFFAADVEGKRIVLNLPLCSEHASKIYKHLKRAIPKSFMKIQDVHQG